MRANIFILLWTFSESSDKYDYRWEIARCQNETIRAEKEREMFFVSPSFPNVNNAEFDCTWKLQAPAGMRVKIQWPVFHLTSCNLKSNVKVYDGTVSKTTEFARYCFPDNKRKPPIFVSSTRNLQVTLHQDVQAHGKGVKIMCGFQATNEPSSNIHARKPVITTRRPITRRRSTQQTINKIIETPKATTAGPTVSYPDNYYYDYDAKQEQIFIEKKRKEKIAEEKYKKSVDYMFKMMKNDDKWALIGGAFAIIVFLCVVSFMLFKRKKRLRRRERENEEAEEAEKAERELEERKHKR
jgi:cbb3-type cytochrome oxidase subunit 3